VNVKAGNLVLQDTIAAQRIRQHLKDKLSRMPSIMKQNNHCAACVLPLPVAYLL
jgi:hypothetical protein